MAKRRPTRKPKRKKFLAPKKPPAKPAVPLSSFASNYGPDNLRHIGPVLAASWSLPSSRENKLSEAGQSIPEPVSGLLLLDTGADRTCISRKAADALNLPMTRLAKGHGSGGMHENPVYWAKLTIRIATPDGGKRTEMSWQQEVLGIQDLEKPFQHKNFRFGGENREVVGLLGRDILRHTRFRYDGIAGRLEIDFDLSTLGQEPTKK